MKPSCGIKQWSATEKDSNGKREVFWFSCSTHHSKERFHTKSSRSKAIDTHRREHA